MSAALETAVEELFIRAITEGAETSGIYTPDIEAVHFSEDVTAEDSAIIIEATVSDEISGGCNPSEVEVKIHLRSRSDVPIEDEDEMWAAIEAIARNMGYSEAAEKPGLETLAPETQDWSEETFAWTLFRYSKSKVERQSADNFRHRIRHLPMEAKLV